MSLKTLLLGALCALLPLSGSAQNTVRGNSPTAPAPAAIALPSAGDTSTVGILVPANSKLSPGDVVSIRIVEDNEDAWKTVVTDTGDVELPAMGSVSVANRTASEASVVVGSYLRGKYYNKATVEFKILRKSTVRPDKVTVAGKVQRPGPQYFTETSPLKLSEAVIVAGTTAFSNLDKVQLTRRGQNTVYNVTEITKRGRTDLDITLQNGDQIFIFEKGIVFGG
jgi:polysaccharide export outer membrane protein